MARPTVFKACIPGEDRGLYLLREACSSGASAIVCLGMGSLKKGLCVETHAANLIDNEQYCPPELNKKPIDPNRPYGEKLRVDLSPWNIDRLRATCVSAEIPTEVSADAGGFCCNHLMYQICRAQSAAPAYQKVPWIFIHVPCCPEAALPTTDYLYGRKTVMSVTSIISGLEILLREASL